MSEKVSIIIRTKNEEKWIGQCLKRLKEQTYQNFEVILVDNNSSDQTVEKARVNYPNLILVSLDTYLPGDAINRGIESSNGQLLAILSAHCLPINDTWLENMVRNLEDSKVAGVYGRQVPMRFTSPTDKRDLLITFGLDKKIQFKDTFFHNANSLIRRSVWEKYPFDKNVTNIEDRVWGKTVIDAGYVLIYEPDSPVYHHHGIHQNNDANRYINVVRILEELKLNPEIEQEKTLNPYELEIVSIVPLMDRTYLNLGEPLDLLKATIETIKASSYIDKLIISVDSERLVSILESFDVETFLRPESLSSSEVRADHVINYTLSELELNGYFADLIVPIEMNHPFRPPDLLDSLIEDLLEKGLDCVIAGFPEYRPTWVENNEQFDRMDEHNISKDQRQPIHIGLSSLGCVCHVSVFRQEGRIGGELGIYEVHDELSKIQINSKSDLSLFRKLNQ
jgi:glycosyltransferase involved in cell wall biosynthesis